MRPVVSTVMLSWNRVDLLRRAVESCLSSATAEHELLIVDNGSTDGAAEYARDVSASRANCTSILLATNRGGEAFNEGLERADGEYLHVAGNDMEYLPGWDANLLGKFQAFPELGQLSVLSPFPQQEAGEVWEPHAAVEVARNGQSIHVTEQNVGESFMMPRRCWDMGFRWHNLPLVQDSPFLFPDDGRASREIRELGFWTAWNDVYVVQNVGHNIQEFVERIDYYVANYTAKGWFGLEGWKKRLNAHGYDLVLADDQYRIVKL